MKLTDLTIGQLERVYARLRARVTEDCYGADWRTLYVTDRSLHDALRAVLTAIGQKRGAMPARLD